MMTIDPKAMYMISGAHIVDFAKAVVEQMQVQPTRRYLEMNSASVREHLLGKGYPVVADASLKNWVEKLNLHINRVRRGKEYWYQTAEVEAIPPRLKP